MQEILDFIDPIDKLTINEDGAFTDGQFGHTLTIYEADFPDLSEVDIVLIGIPEFRGTGNFQTFSNSANAIRKQFYQLHCWHPDLKIADIGNIKKGDQLKDSYFALQKTLEELLARNKTVIILGGSHDITLAQYNAYKAMGQIIEATCIDALIDLKGESNLRNENFLLEMLTGEPNMIRHYNHVGFQSYFVHPRLIETMDKLRFDCFRVGRVKEQIEEMEPTIRNSQLVSFDISSLKNSAAPSNLFSTNGFNGEEACILSQFAGMSTQLSSFGIYGYDASLDQNELTAKQIAQMIWYFIDGISKKRNEPSLSDTSNFVEYHTFFAEVETLFLQNKKTKRWWMQMPDKKFIPCSINDYLCASNNEMPERWLRTQERS